MTALLPLSAQQVNAALNPVQLQVKIDDSKINQPGDPKSPILIPSINIEDYTLYFDTPCDGCTLRLVNEDNEVEYTTVIPVGADELVLPSYLSGEYELQIFRGIYCFYGYIDL